MVDLKNLNYLLPKTREVLLDLVANAPFLEKYVLVGGSALSLHLCHRQSEDLDFFAHDDDVDIDEILDYLGQHHSELEIINQTAAQVDLLTSGVKLTFFNPKWDRLKPEGQIQRFNLIPIERISGMKVQTLFLRAKYRDYYDLYMISGSGIPLRRIYEEARYFVNGLSFKLFAAALIYIDDVEDENITHLNPKVKISKQEIRNHFETLLKK